jgi:arginyl-tRNA synthetase
MGSELVVRDTDVEALLAGRVIAAVRTVFGTELSVADVAVRPSGAGRHADFQSGTAMRLAKRTGLPPLEAAQRLADAIQTDDLIEATAVSGPGFVNVVVRGEWLEGAIARVVTDERLGVPRLRSARRFVVDYSAPNVAKEMHVGHLRSTIIGDALVRILRFLGHEVVPQNHVGDWGTPFGMLIEHVRGQEWAGSETGPIEDLNEFYRSARERFDSEPGYADRSRARVVALQAEDPDTLALGKRLVTESERHFDEVYATLGVLLCSDDLAGESLYNPMLEDVVRDLERRGIAVLADGAVCVFPPGFTNRDGEPLPLIIRKRDGGYTYGTTDLAAIRHRVQTLDADEILYVVGTPQHLHLSMVFAAARMAGWLPDEVKARHVAFGSVLGEDGKMLRTRAGANVKLIDLLAEAQDRAEQVLKARRPELSEQRALARSIGIGAVKYADLSTDRERDYTFSWERMLALEGNTSVYLQYASARAESIIRKAEITSPQPPSRFVLDEPAERALVLQLLAFPAALESVTTSMRPDKLCGYLHDTAVAFSTFYDACPILKHEDETIRASRLGLTHQTQQVLNQGLNLLGIDAPDQL